MREIRLWKRRWGEGLKGLAFGLTIGDLELYKPACKWVFRIIYRNKAIPWYYLWHATEWVLERLLFWRQLHRLPRLRRAILTLYHKMIDV